MLYLIEVKNWPVLALPEELDDYPRAKVLGRFRDDDEGDAVAAFDVAQREALARLGGLRVRSRTQMRHGGDLTQAGPLGTQRG